ncbi:MAG: hypothetical protein IJB88_03655 [Clostridia bacterium]|nr:hypothetical protein [Clostridia bacterium]
MHRYPLMRSFPKEGFRIPLHLLVAKICKKSQFILPYFDQKLKFFQFIKKAPGNQKRAEGLFLVLVVKQKTRGNQKKTRRSFFGFGGQTKDPRQPKKSPMGSFLVLGSFGGIYASRRKGGENLRNDRSSGNSVRICVLTQILTIAYAV